MNPRSSSPAPRLSYIALVATGPLVALALSMPVAGQTPRATGYVGDDPAKFQTTKYPQTPCGECHLPEQTVWQTTRHAKGFKDLHRRESAERIARNMGLRLIKRDSPCLSCHYTPAASGSQLKAISGVSCESCHGASRDWIDVHNDYGQGADYASESEGHRLQRVEQSRDAGMRRATDLYGVVSRCYQCHFVLDQRLVNVGQHNTGSGGFELVEWSQGTIRHNFLQALVGGGAENAERPAERKRVMHVVGRALELEYGLRGMAQATDDKGTYAKAMGQRVNLAARKLRSIAKKVDSPEVNEILGTVRDVQIRINNRPALLAAAERIGETIQRFIAERDGSRLAAVDGFLQADDAAEEAAVAQPGGTTAPAAPSPATPARATGGGGSHETLGPGSCSGCHVSQNAWWNDDAHADAEDPFFDEAEENVRIAKRYGLDPEEMILGTSVCMNCHSTVATGKKGREVDDGVSCEACHGPAKDYREPHQAGDRSLGLQRPGYIEALRLGMFELKVAGVRATVCTGCHYITDEKLLQAGHGSGKGFDYAGGIRKINHWEGQSVSDGDLRAAVDAARASRGAVPSVQVAESAPAGTPQTTPPSTPTTTTTPSTQPVPPPPPPSAPAPIVVTGQPKKRIRPTSSHETIGPASCSATCHKLQNDWWLDDAHYATADPFLDGSAGAEQIARKYGINPKNMAKGNEVCMDCHGTVVTRKQKRTVSDGVGCEECHGPAMDYLDPHQEKGGDDRDTRPGYVNALRLGLVKLRDLELRGRVCSDCHAITDPRLISAGHPRGQGFDYVAGMRKIRHWEAEPAAPEALLAAFGKVLGARNVRMTMRRPPVEDRPRTGAQTAATPMRPSAPIPRPIAPQVTQPSSIALTPFPEIDDSTSVEEILILLKQRLEELHRAVYGTP